MPEVEKRERVAESISERIIGGCFVRVAVAVAVGTGLVVVDVGTGGCLGGGQSAAVGGADVAAAVDGGEAFAVPRGGSLPLGAVQHPRPKERRRGACQ